ncbi:MAG: response regulator [Acidobacteria bacterium]|nr:response regulator [Acidobacteriota bacterium]
MDREFRILILEDSLTDAELLQRELRKGGVLFVARCAESRDSFVKQLEEFQPDLILSDYTLPSFDGLAALELVRQKSSEIPFIFVSGSIGEERAIEVLKVGATDYILKDRLGRLAPAVLRAVREVEEHSERKKLEEQLRQAQKMEAIGQLTGGIAHDFNNLLTVINGYADLSLARLPEKDPAHKHLEEIRKAGHRAASLTHQLLAFSRQQILEPKVLDLNAIVVEMEKMLRRLIGEDIELACALAPDLGRVKADSGQIEQVIMNLAVNARDAMPQGGKLTIETANVELDEAYARNHVAVRPGAYVLLAVSDTGCGMDKEVQSHLFEPFFTTKEPGEGTGLGLSTVYGIVKQSGGNIWVYSEPGHGATFKIYLPAVEEVVAVASPEGARPLAMGGSETILLAEDDEPVRNLARQILEMHGYTVLEAQNGREALEICKRHEGPIHLMVTDVVMPQMSGRDLADRAAQLRPGIKLLYLSGYTGKAIVQHGVLEPGVAFLQKPFTPDALARKVREVLDAPREG